MGCLSKEQIIGANDLPMEKVYVPEWANGDPEAYVMVKGLTADEKDQWELEQLTSHDGEHERDFSHWRARLCIRCMVDDDGNRLFSKSEVLDLSNKSAKALERVYRVAHRLSGLGKEVEVLEKNSEPGLNDSSPSSLPL